MLTRRPDHRAVLTKAAVVAPWTIAVLVVMGRTVSTGVSVADTAVFALYVALGLVLPGTLLWRIAVPGDSRSLLTDTVCGTALAYAVELLVYLACAHVGLAGLARAWVVVPVALAIALPEGRRRVLRPNRAMPWWWSPVCASVMTLAALVFLGTAAGLTPLSGAAARSPYVDLPYHLALITGLERHVPTQLPFLSGEPLYYHWFAHAHLAAAHHATGIESWLLLTRLGALPMIAVATLGIMVLALRLTRSPLAGVVAGVVLVVANGSAVDPAFGRPYIPELPALSITTTYAQALLVGVLAGGHPPAHLPTHRSVDLVAAGLGRGRGPHRRGLRGEGPGGPPPDRWDARAGRHAPVRAHAVAPRPPALAGDRGGGFLASQQLVYGGSSQGTSVRLFGISAYVAHDYGLVTDPADAHLPLRLAIGVLILCSNLAVVVGTVGLFLTERWRDPVAHFVVGVATGGVLGLVLVENAGRNQLYFLRVAEGILVLAGVWGLYELARRLTVVQVVRTSVLATLAGVLLSVVMLLATPGSLVPGKSTPTLSGLLAPTIALAVVLALVAWGIVLLGRRHAPWRGTAPLACVVVVMVMCVVHGSPGVWERISPASSAQVSAPTIGVGGVGAARWLRDHSDPDALVATNEHCRIAHQTICDHRTTWVAGFTERQVLIEGWSYTSRSAAEAARQNLPVPFIKYWHPRELQANNRVFRRPTTTAVDRLGRYGVDWLFVDRRFPSDVPAMTRVLGEPEFRRGDYVIYRMP